MAYVSPNKSDLWRIVYNPVVSADVQFEDEVTKEEAIQLFKEGDFLDIVDSEELEIDFVSTTDTHPI